MRNQKCPLCEARARAERNGDEELAQQLKPSHRVLVWALDRSRDGDPDPLLWAMPLQVDEEIVALSIDRDTNTTKLIEDPREGYDVLFDS